jgi:hypothetical protein
MFRIPRSEEELYWHREGCIFDRNLVLFAALIGAISLLYLGLDWDWVFGLRP